MKVFVTGGSGFVGGAILRELTAKGHQGVIFTRDGNGERVRALAKECGATIAEGTVGDPEALHLGMRGCDAVIHLVGIISEFRGNTFQKAHVDATRNVLAAEAELNIPRHVHMSALGADSNSGSEYHRTKFAAETLVRESGRAWTIFRPSVIYGPEDGFVNLLANICRLSPVAPVMGPGTNKLQPVAIEDVARCFVDSLNREATHGRTLDLCGTEVLTMNEIMSAIVQAMDRRRALFHVPLPLARLQAGLLESVFPKVLGKPAPLTRDQLKMLRVDNVGDHATAAKLFELPERSFAEGIRSYLRQ